MRKKVIFVTWCLSFKALELQGVWLTVIKATNELLREEYTYWVKHTSNMQKNMEDMETKWRICLVWVGERDRDKEEEDREKISVKERAREREMDVIWLSVWVLDSHRAVLRLKAQHVARHDWCKLTAAVDKGHQISKRQHSRTLSSGLSERHADHFLSCYLSFYAYT